MRIVALVVGILLFIGPVHTAFADAETILEPPGVDSIPDEDDTGNGDELTFYYAGNQPIAANENINLNIFKPTGNFFSLKLGSKYYIFYAVENKVVIQRCKNWKTLTEKSQNILNPIVNSMIKAESEDAFYYYRLNFSLSNNYVLETLAHMAEKHHDRHEIFQGSATEAEQRILTIIEKSVSPSSLVELLLHSLAPAERKLEILKWELVKYKQQTSELKPPYRDDKQLAAVTKARQEDAKLFFKYLEAVLSVHPLPLEGGKMVRVERSIQLADQWITTPLRQLLEEEDIHILYKPGSSSNVSKWMASLFVYWVVRKDNTFEEEAINKMKAALNRNPDLSLSVIQELLRMNVEEGGIPTINEDSLWTLWRQIHRPSNSACEQVVSDIGNQIPQDQ